MNLPLLENQKNLVGKKTLLRLDLNVPIKDDKVVDDFRIRKILPTLELLHSAGAKTIILSHLEGKGGDSLRPIWQELIKKYTISFSANFSQLSKNFAELENGGFTLFENLRADPGEKANDENFAKKLLSAKFSSMRPLPFPTALTLPLSVCRNFCPVLSVHCLPKS